MHEKLELLLYEGVVDEVLGGLKSGKEAEIWLVRHAGEVLAAKIYKERAERSFHNNAVYKEGRGVRNSRTERAIERGSQFGRKAEEEAWKAAEADALFTLHAQGVRTPRPVAFYEGVLLMELVVDAVGRPAKRLIDVAVTAEEARAVYMDVRREAVRMLCADRIHGDLSPYNILLGAAGPTLIDFPQVIAAAHNSSAERFFVRDLENVRQHLARFDHLLNGHAGDAREIWHAYVRRELTPEFVPTGRVEQPRAGARPAQGGRPHAGAPANDRGHGRFNRGQDHRSPERRPDNSSPHKHKHNGPPGAATKGPAGRAHGPPARAMPVVERVIRVTNGPSAAPSLSARPPTAGATPDQAERSPGHHRRHRRRRHAPGR